MDYFLGYCGYGLDCFGFGLGKLRMDGFELLACRYIYT